MKNKKDTKPAPKLFKIETGIEPPKKRGKENTISNQIFDALKKLPVGGSFLILSKHEPAARKIIKDNPAKFKDWSITIRKAEEGKDYRRVFRLPATAVLLQKNKTPKDKK